jgi:2-haloacid dehalogenase
MKKICIFDVNETLLDLSALDPLFKKIFGISSVRQLWFQLFIHNAFLSIITDSYEEFAKIGLAALEIVAAKLNVNLKTLDKLAIANQLKNLPPHKDVIEGLKYLKQNGYKLYTLTNSTESFVKTQVQNAKISEYFEHTFSAESVKRLKPAKEPYEYVAKQLNVEPKDLILIASHAWDIVGAQKAGYSTGFIARPGMILNPLVKKPNFIAKDLQELAKLIVSNENINSLQ